MPPQRTSGRPNDSRNLTEAQKGAIVALRKLSNTEYAYIAGAMVPLELNLRINPPRPLRVKITYEHRDHDHTYAIIQGRQESSRRQVVAKEEKNYEETLKRQKGRSPLG
ncbi:hypothetical protein BU23DRAFT_563608 [Bimuria novae-zelandiae CBS 107.79]|uniref:Uncharacterized protein n=1 Tax=Bimuria novae-zelandiae CBS 107.79 TaxID=1447943 RepID=A0A6A5VR28_9PLEO|nr:hypothetical protein BU23DRAFT_563608 [Bimuria novae-zelandiae CBS 107.79]